MPALTTTELTDLLNEDSIARAEARTLANISRRAQTLFTDGGYSALPLGGGRFCIFSPKGDTYAVFISETPDCEVFGSSCSCPCFAARRTCKHLQAVVLSIEEGADLDAEQDAYDPYEYRY